MAFPRGLILASLSVSVLALTACGSTGSSKNMTNEAGASRVDAILELAARDAKASGNKAEAVAILEPVYIRNPDDAAVATGFGQALREDEQLNRARQVLLPFTEGDKAYPDAVTELAMVQLALGQYKEAELTSRRAVQLDPNSGRAFLALGTALDAQNYHEQAEVAFRRGIDKWQGDPAPIMNNLALNLASQNKLDQAIDMLRKAQEISPGRIELERNMRIITTLKEGADDFTVRQQNAKKQAAAPKQVEKPAETTVTTVKKETVVIDREEGKPAGAKPAKAKAVVETETIEKKTVRKDDAKKTTTTKTETTVKSSAATNARGSRQNFNSDTND